MRKDEITEILEFKELGKSKEVTSTNVLAYIVTIRAYTLEIDVNKKKDR